MRRFDCPSCGSESAERAEFDGVFAADLFVCSFCSSFFGEVNTEADLHKVFPAAFRPMQSEASSLDAQAPFDLTVRGVRRLHGFVDNVTGRVVQWG